LVQVFGAEIPQVGLIKKLSFILLKA
jgi:hypothetical protein